MARIVGVVSTLVCATSKYLEQTNKHTQHCCAFETAPVGLAGAGSEAGSAFFSRNDGITESGKKLWRGGGWLVSRNHSGWMAGSRRNYCGNRDSGFRTSSGASYIREFQKFLQGFASFIGSGGRPKLAEKVVTPYGNSPYTGGCSFNSYRK